jgi:hypothetical protein
LSTLFQQQAHQYRAVRLFVEGDFKVIVDPPGRLNPGLLLQNLQQVIPQAASKIIPAFLEEKCVKRPW